MKPGGAELQLGRLGDLCRFGAELELGVPRVQAEAVEVGAPRGKADEESPRLGWYSRGYLPHRDEVGLIQSLTFRLADSLPQEKLRQLDRELALEPMPVRDVERRKRMEGWLDAGLGCCALAHPRMAETMEDALLRFDGERYRLLAWCIMPNHVHTLIEPSAPLPEIVKSWKSFTGRWALPQGAALGFRTPGKSFWMREVWDRFIRDDTHLRRTIDYIHQNPVKAGLCASPTAWAWSSARFDPAGD